MTSAKATLPVTLTSAIAVLLLLPFVAALSCSGPQVPLSYSKSNFSADRAQKSRCALTLTATVGIAKDGVAFSGGLDGTYAFSGTQLCVNVSLTAR